MRGIRCRAAAKQEPVGGPGTIEAWLVQPAGVWKTRSARSRHQASAALLFAEGESRVERAILFRNGHRPLRSGIATGVDFEDRYPWLRNTLWAANPDPRPESRSPALPKTLPAEGTAEGTTPDVGQYVGAFGEDENWLEERTCFGPESDCDTLAKDDGGNWRRPVFAQDLRPKGSSGRSMLPLWPRRRREGSAASSEVSFRPLAWWRGISASRLTGKTAIIEPISARSFLRSSSGAPKFSSIPAGSVARSRCPGRPCPASRRMRDHRVAGGPGREPLAGGRDDAVADRESTLSAPLLRSRGMRSRRRLATGNPVARFGAGDGVGLRRGTASHDSLWGCRNRFRPACTAEMLETSFCADRVQRAVIETS